MKVGLCGFTIGAAAYFETFGVVEVQQTFYDPPAPSTLDRWRAQAPPAFEFTMKAWRLHGNGSHYASYTDDELAQLRAWLPGAGDACVMFNNIPRVGDAKRFLARSPPGHGRGI